MPPPKAAVAYDGAAPFPGAAPGARPVGGPVQVVVTGALAVLPLTALGVGIWLAWGHRVGLTDLLLMAGMYAITRLGVTEPPGTRPERVLTPGTALTAR